MRDDLPGIRFGEQTPVDGHEPPEEVGNDGGQQSGTPLGQFEGGHRRGSGKAVRHFSTDGGFRRDRQNKRLVFRSAEALRRERRADISQSKKAAICLRKVWKRLRKARRIIS